MIVRRAGSLTVAERDRWNAHVRFIRTDEDNSAVVGVSNDVDAPLFAAAPDLLASLEETLEAFIGAKIALHPQLFRGTEIARRQIETLEGVQRAKAAIDKAKGVTER